MTESTVVKQELVVKDGRLLSLDGVVSVDALGDDYLTVNTVSGSITVEGESLKIESLTKEDGKIKVIGKISGVFYKETVEKQGLFKRLFG